jgi:hypothetical protein
MVAALANTTLMDCHLPRILRHPDVINKAREWGYTDVPKPCQGVKGFREEGRDRYVTETNSRR